jgi:hypothetical protein
MNDYIMSECSTCGTTWVTGRYAHHSCTAKLVSDNDALTARVAELEAAFEALVNIAADCDGWEYFPEKYLDDARKALEWKS